MTGIYARTASLAILVHLYQTPKAVAHGCFWCVCRSPPLLPGTTKAPLLKLSRVVLGTIVRSHMETGENMQKKKISLQPFFPNPVDSSEIVISPLCTATCKHKTHPPQPFILLLRLDQNRAFLADFCFDHIVQKSDFSDFQPKILRRLK